MWKVREYYKDNKVSIFETAILFSFFKNSDNEFLTEDKLFKEGYMEMFDKRVLSNIRGNGSSLILENDSMPLQTLIDFQEEISNYGISFKSTKKYQFTSLDKRQIPEIEKLINDDQYEPNKVTNIIIDSLFQDINQFRYMVNNLFAHFTKLNFFISSRGTLQRIINNELKNHMDKYPVRNQYYNRFNELTFTLLKNNIYELNLNYENDNSKIDTITQLILNDDNTELIEKQTYKFLYGKYKKSWVDIKSKTKENKW